MLADIAVSERTVDGVGYGVHRDISIGMACKRLFVWDFHATKYDVITGRKAVYVEPVAKSDVHKKAFARLPAIPALQALSCDGCADNGDALVVYLHKI